MDINPFKSKFIYKIQLFVFDNKFKCCYFNEFRIARLGCIYRWRAHQFVIINGMFEKLRLNTIYKFYGNFMVFLSLDEKLMAI